VDDGSTAVVPQVREHGLRQAQRRHEIDREGALDRVERFLLGGNDRLDRARRVHEDRGGTELLDHRGHHAVDLRGIGQVALHRDPTDLRGEFVESLATTRHHRDPRAGGREFASDPGTQPGRRAGDDRDLVGDEKSVHDLECTVAGPLAEGDDVAMDFDLGADVDALRNELRALVDRHVPDDFLGACTDDPADLATAQAFCRTLAADGQLCPAWPTEYGGRDASAWEQTAVREEMWAAHEPRGAQYMGVNWVGPTIMRHGTPEQKARHLPPIAHGEVIWCQGFSEPDAGSDLASLQTSATRDGHEWVITGQKIWTSYATMAQWCFLLARTSREERRQQGLTVFLVPMDDPAIEVRPIASMLGPHHLNEVFFDQLRVGDDAVLGPVGGGWQVVQEVLAFERVGIARYARCERLLQWAPVALSDAWERLPEALRTQWTRMLVHCRRARLLAYRVVAQQDAGAVRPGDAAAYRIAVTTLDQESADLLVEIAADTPPGEEGERFRRAVDDHWTYSRAATVSSGAIEIQRVLLARALLADRTTA